MGSQTDYHYLLHADDWYDHDEQLMNMDVYTRSFRQTK